MLVREISSQAPDEYDLLGFLDDDKNLQGTSVAGLPVLGVCDDLPRVAGRVSADEVIIAVPTATREFNRKIVSLCRDARVSFRIVPGIL